MHIFRIESLESKHLSGQAGPCIQFFVFGDQSRGDVVVTSAKAIGVEGFGPHDARRSCAKLCRKEGGKLEQIQYMLGHESIETTAIYTACEQEIAVAVNDSLGL